MGRGGGGRWGGEGVGARAWAWAWAWRYLNEEVSATRRVCIHRWPSPKLSKTGVSRTRSTSREPSDWSKHHTCVERAARTTSRTKQHVWRVDGAGGPRERHGRPLRPACPLPRASVAATVSGVTAHVGGWEAASPTSREVPRSRRSTTTLLVLFCCFILHARLALPRRRCRGGATRTARHPRPPIIHGTAARGLPPSPPSPPPPLAHARIIPRAPTARLLNQSP